MSQIQIKRGVVSSTDIQRHFRDVMRRVTDGEHIVVERDGIESAVLIPMREYRLFMSAWTSDSQEMAGYPEAVRAIVEKSSRQRQVEAALADQADDDLPKEAVAILEELERQKAERVKMFEDATRSFSEAVQESGLSEEEMLGSLKDTRRAVYEKHYGKR